MTGLEWTHKCSKRNSVINIQDFPARNASGRASIALRRSAKAVPGCRRWSPPASCTCTCSAAVDAILHSFKNAQVVIQDNDRSFSKLDNGRSLSGITTCKCALLLSLIYPHVSTLRKEAILIKKRLLFPRPKAHPVNQKQTFHLPWKTQIELSTLMCRF